MAAPPGNVISNVEQVWSMSKTIFKITTSGSETVLRIEGPLFPAWDFCGDRNFKVCWWWVFHIHVFYITKDPKIVTFIDHNNCRSWWLWQLTTLTSTYSTMISSNIALAFFKRVEDMVHICTQINVYTLKYQGQQRVSPRKSTLNCMMCKSDLITPDKLFMTHLVGRSTNNT